MRSSRTIEELSRLVESLVHTYIAWSTNDWYDDVLDEAGYREVRKELLLDSRVRNLLPDFVKKHRSNETFWPFIKNKFKSYAERREYIWNQFEPLINWLEQQELNPAPPSDHVVSTVLASVDSEWVRTTWEKAVERRDSDPEGAITAARSLLETVCKHILDEEEVEYDEQKDDLPKLYRLVANELRLAPSDHTEEIFKQILGGCQSIVVGMAGLRNRLGDAHGMSRRAYKPAPRHAELAVNLAGTMATFLMRTLEVRKQEGKRVS